MINCDFLFFIKAGYEAGFGHLRRSLAIASGLKAKGKSVCFLVNGDDAPMKTLREKGFKAYRFSKTALKLFDPKVAVIDQKGDVSRQVQELRARGSKICLIDNTSKARLISDVVIFPVSHFKDNLSWKGFKGKKYVGAKYFPLNNEFLKAKPVRHKDFTILITMGGSDPNRLSSKVAAALRSLDAKFKAVIVLGAASKNQSIPKDKRFTVIKDPKNMAQLMAQSDIAVTAFGTTLYELAYMGVPALIISNYKKERDEIETFENLGTSTFLGYFKSVSDISILDAVNHLMNSRKYVLRLSRNGKKLIDGKGTARIVKILDGISLC